MKELVRFSVSGLLGFIITAALFVGMLSLLKGQKHHVKSTDTQINFSMVKDYQEAVVKEKPPREKPEPQEVSQAPAMPAIAIDKTPLPAIELPTDSQIGTDTNFLEGVKMPGLGGTGYGKGNELSGMIKTAIAPMYPQKPLISKTEGWVKVLITVNQFGAVSDVKVLQAKPARDFNSAAIKAVRKWKFHPKLDGEQAVSFQVTQTIEFKLDQ